MLEEGRGTEEVGIYLCQIWAVQQYLAFVGWNICGYLGREAAYVCLFNSSTREAAATRTISTDFLKTYGGVNESVRIILA